ncbi:MAG: hypothetical protein JW706_00520, partial [Opitutales bacterium]|nr:hypothetical protein [Opitutales bacterium]
LRCSASMIAPHDAAYLNPGKCEIHRGFGTSSSAQRIFVSRRRTLFMIAFLISLCWMARAPLRRWPRHRG